MRLIGRLSKLGRGRRSATFSLWIGSAALFCAIWVPDTNGDAYAAHKKATKVASAEKIPADAHPYTVSIKPTGEGELDAMVNASSTLLALQNATPVGPFPLSGRIRGEYDRLTAALESRGYYDGSVAITVTAKGQSKIDGRDPSLPQWFQHLPAGTKVAIAVTPTTGPRFSIGHISLLQGPLRDDGGAKPVTASAPEDSLRKGSTEAARRPNVEKNGRTLATQTDAKDGAPTAPPRNVMLSHDETRSFGLRSGQPAIAGDILAAQDRLQNLLLEEGHALGAVQTPVAYLRPASKTLDLEFRIGLGPVVAVGPIHFDGLTHVRETYIRRRLQLREGQLYRPSEIEAARQDLASTGVFASVSVKDVPPLVALAAGQGRNGLTQAMPLDFTFQEGKRHTVSADIGYSTDLGGRLGASWTHHNLLGNAERLKLTALVTGLGGSAQQGLGYDVYADFLKPDFLRRDQNLSLRLEGVRQLLYSYHQTALIARGGITRRLNRFWNVNGSLMAEQESIRQFGDTRSYFIAAIPMGATFDSTSLSNPIDPATHGARVSLTAAPSVSLETRTSFFAILTAAASTYFDFHRLGWTRAGRSVLAVRGIVGSVQGASTYQIPPDQRLYAGGPATVRGFRYQGVGPQIGKYAVGGTAMDAGSVEYRQRILKSFGAAVFADAGQVDTGSIPFRGKLRVGYGAGVRYYTPIGPVRVDIALPSKRPPRGDRFELYIGLGETF